MTGDAQRNRAGVDDVAELADAYAHGLASETPSANGTKRRRHQAQARDGGRPEADDDFEDVPDELGHVVLDDVAGWLTQHVAWSSQHHVPAVALWVAHTHALAAAASTPRLAFVSPEPGSGKTRVLELLELLVRRGRHVLSMTPAALFRVVEAQQPTILLDEVDAIFGPKASRDHEDLRALINAGHRPGATVMRVVGEGGSMRAREFSAYCPVALAGLGDLPATIATRAITIPMRRRAPDEYVRPYRERTTRPEGDQLRRRLAAWLHRHTDAIPEAPELPAGVTDRPADCWEPLIALADATGGHWPTTARHACRELINSTGSRQESLGVRLLADIRNAFAGETRLSTVTLIERLTALDDAPWAEWLEGKSDKARGAWLAKRLKPYAIAPHAVRIGGSTPKGYDAADFADAWRRYLATTFSDRERHKRNRRNASTSDVASVASVASGGVPKVATTLRDEREEGSGVAPPEPR